MDFKTAVHIVKSRSVSSDAREHGQPGMSSMGAHHPNESHSAASHAEAVRVALEGIENLARTVTGNDHYRRVDGLANNVENPRWGGTLHIQNRLLPNSYQDGKGSPRTLSNKGNPLPSARTISSKCFLPSKEERSFFDPETSQLFFQLGQFLDHDTISTPLAVAFGCCLNGEKQDDSPEAPCFPITIEPGDRFFKCDCMTFRRAFGVKVNGVREQLNSATSFVDASTIYGSSEAELSELRLYQGGLLLVTEDNMLPLKGPYPCVKTSLPQCPLSGDSRVNEIAGLSALHLIYHREHNRLARKLAEVNPHWSEETLFQEARKLNIAQHQNIVYYEFLPKAIGLEVMNLMGIDRPYEYDPEVNPSVLNVFGVAAFRFGHTLLSSQQYFQNNESHTLSELFFRPESVLYRGEGALKSVVQNQAKRLAHKYDSFFTTEITDRLYIGVDSEAEPGESFDLLARNIQRGRDHGARPYVDYLDYCLDRLRGIKGIKQLTLPTCLRTEVYESVSDIDIFLGGIAETPLTGAIMGPTFACILGEQFYRLKFGDRFFFETPDRVRGFSPEQLNNIRETAKFSALICRNTAMRMMQPNALDSRRFLSNQKIPCTDFRDINFELWRQPM